MDILLLPAPIAWSSCPPGLEALQSSENAAIEAILQDRPFALLRMLRTHPDLIEISWQSIMTAIAGAEGIRATIFLKIISSVAMNAPTGWTLDRPIDADANRVAHWAALYGDVAKLEALRTFGANLQIPNRLGTTPLFDAVRGNSPEAIGAIIRTVDRVGLRHFNAYDCSPMHWACMHSSLLAMQALHEADRGLINMPNSSGRMPLDVLKWRKLYHIEAIRRNLARDYTKHEVMSYNQIHRWMAKMGAKHSSGWSWQADKTKLTKANAPFNAELWWHYVDRPSSWESA